jgi:acyl carrier protein
MAVSKQEIEQGLYETVAKVFNKDIATLVPTIRFKEDLGVKSVHGMKLCALLNYKFNVKVPMASLIECATLGDAVDMLDHFINV